MKELVRNYQLEPLKYAELPLKEDLVTLYIRENRTVKELTKYFNKAKETILTWLHKYNIKKTQEQIKQTIERVQLAKYGTKYYMQSKFYQEKKEQINAKRIETNLKKYGSKTPAENEKIKQKAKQTCLRDINSDGLNIYQRARKKGIQTCLAKYGVTTYSQTQECKNKTEQKWKECFGVKSFGETEKFKQLYQDKQWVKGIVNKIYSTKQINHSFNISKEEKFVFEQLSKKFEIVKRQYKSKEYPFPCDFFIPRIELYIECNFHWTHGKDKKKVLGLFNNKNKEHLAVLKKWEEKKSAYYNNAIKTWTIKDVQKLKTFQKHNLNYKIFYTIDEFNQWYETIK